MVLAVNEEFYSIQGEGVSTGIPMYFVRLQGCEVGCYFCDTKYTWKKMNLAKKYFIKELDIVKRAVASHVSWICITGGEPYEQDLRQLTNMARYRKLKVHIETSGTVFQDLPIDHICLSPKDLFSKKQTLRRFKEIAHEFKVVVTKESDLDYYITNYHDIAVIRHIPFVIQLVDNNMSLLPFVMNRIKDLDNNITRVMIQCHKIMQLP